MGSGAGPFAAAQVQLRQVAARAEAFGQAQGVAAGVVPALAQALELLQAISHANAARRARSTRPSPRRPSSAWSASACARFGRSTPCQGVKAQAAVAMAARPARPGAQASAVEPAERRRRADHRQARLVRLDAEMTPRTPRRTPPGRHPLVRRGNPGAPARPPSRLLGQLLQQVAHPRLLRLGTLEEQVEQRQHQRLARSAGNAARGRSRAGQPASPKTSVAVGAQVSARPDVMGMFEHRQVFAAVPSWMANLADSAW